MFHHADSAVSCGCDAVFAAAVMNASFGCVSNHQGALSGSLREGSHESMGHGCRLLPCRLCRGAAVIAVAAVTAVATVKAVAAITAVTAIVAGVGPAIRSCLDTTGHDRG